MKEKENHIKWHKDDGPSGKIGPKMGPPEAKVYPKVQLNIPKVEVNKKK